MWKPTAAVDAEYLKEIEKARRELRAFISGENCAPHMLRLAWYAAGTYDANMRPGKLDGSVKHEVEAYEGLKTAVDFCGAQHSREVFHRMGLTDKDIVALCGAHTLGEAHDEPSGSQGQRTRKTLKFDNSYFVELESSGKAPRQPVSIGKPRLPLPTDNALLEDPGFRNYVKIYAKDEDAFFKDYAASHKKLSELAFKRKHLEIIVSCKGL